MSKERKALEGARAGREALCVRVQHVADALVSGHSRWWCLLRAAAAWLEHSPHEVQQQPVEPARERGGGCVCALCLSLSLSLSVCLSLSLSLALSLSLSVCLSVSLF